MTNHKPSVPALRAGASITPIVPSSFEEAYRFGQAVVKAGMAPASVNTPEKAMVAILHGMEVGLTPMAALQSIAVVNGMPTIWGDGALALVRSSGELISFKEWWEGPEGQETAFCKIIRAGYEDEPTIQSFSHKDAEVSGLLHKTGPWKLYPKRMKQMRARSWAMRDCFADVLRGLRITEEAQDIPADIVTEDGEVLSRPAQIVAQRMAAKAQAADPAEEEQDVEAEFEPADEAPQESVEVAASGQEQVEAEQDQPEVEEGAEAAQDNPADDYGATWFIAELAVCQDWPGIDQALTLCRKGPAWADGGPLLQSQIRRAAFHRLTALVQDGYNFDFLTNAQAWRCYLEAETNLEQMTFNRKMFTKEAAWTNLGTAAKINLGAAWDAAVVRIKDGADGRGQDTGSAFQ